ncbi:MAG TPA: riboflavin synthase [Thermoanaerobaculia bacterium]
MFTGIVHERGRLLSDPAASGRGGSALAIGHGRELAARLEVGASLAVAGVCLTVTELADVPGGGARSLVELSPETLSRTTLGHFAAGDAVNLEPALRVGDSLGGHWVQGHVDGVISLLHRHDEAEHSTFVFELPEAFAPYLVEKGSVALDGVSLTIARPVADRFRVALIPHTLEVTTLGDLEPGDHVNLEVDVLAKYVERLLARRGSLPG